MAKVIRDGYHPTSSPANAIHTGRGMLRGFLICPADLSAFGQVTFYDNTTATGTVLLSLDLPAAGAPFYVQFPRDHAPRFSTGLSLTLSNATVTFWSLDFG